MSNHHDDTWETEMSRTFDQRVRDLHEAPLTLDHVKGRARRIRRTRRIAGAAAGLAAAAVIVPLAVFAGQGLTSDDSGPDPAKPTPNPTVIDTESPGFGYLEGRTLHLPDGSTMTLPERYDRVTLLGDTVLASRNDPDTGFYSLDVIDETGTVTDTTETSVGPVTNSDHTTVAYLETDGDLITRWEGGEVTLATGLSDNVYPVAVIGGPDCNENADGCRVILNDDIDGPRSVDSRGLEEPFAPDAITVEDADGSGLFTVMNKSMDEGSCGGVYDETKGSYLWETCESFLFDFSPDSTYVNATHAYLDGIGNGYATILDAKTGEELARLEPPEGFITTTVWQDDEHLLATVYEPQGWSIYRLGADNSVERVVGPSDEGDDVTPAYVLLDGA